MLKLHTYVWNLASELTCDVTVQKVDGIFVCLFNVELVSVFNLFYFNFFKYLLIIYSSLGDNWRFRGHQNGEDIVSNAS